jgi:hypothetical protein
MLQIRPGDLITVRHGGAEALFAILTRQILFGGDWSYVFHDGASRVWDSTAHSTGSGFNAAVDFIVPKREGRIARLSRDNDFSSLMGPELLQQEPAMGEINYRIWRWKDGRRREAEWVRFTPLPSSEEKSAPRYSCIPADMACALAARRWQPCTSIWLGSRGGDN